MPSVYADTAAAQLEVVKGDLEKIFEQSDQIAGRVKKSLKAQTISRYFWRMPFKQWPGGNFAKVSMEGGTMPTGTGMKLGYLQAGYFSSVLAFRINQEQIDTSQNSSQSVVNVLSETLASAMVEAQVLDDIAFHTDGTGVLTNGASAGTATATAYFADTTDFLGVNNLREGMCVEVWDAALTTIRAAATAVPIIITAIDYESKIVTFDQTVTALAATDRLVFRGGAAYGSVTPASFSATYPVTGAAGVGGDSFRHGFPYMTDVTSSNYLYGKLKSTYPQLQPVAINAAGNPLEWDHAHRLIAKIQRKRDGDAWKGLFGIAHMAQRAAVFNLGMASSTKLVTGAQFGQSVNLLPSNIGYSDEFDFGGIPMVTSKRQDRSRLDFINPNKIGRAQLYDTKFLDLGTGRTVFEGRASSGSPAAYLEFFVGQSYDYACFDPGTFGRIYNLALPEGWDA